jgi:hypothetical protein
MVWLLINKVLQTMIKINYKACRERERGREIPQMGFYYISDQSLCLQYQ